MDRGSVDVSDMRHLTGVAKTLRRLYVPAEAPDAAIARALELLAMRETTTREATMREASRLSGARRLAPAA